MFLFKRDRVFRVIPGCLFLKRDKGSLELEPVSPRLSMGPRSTTEGGWALVGLRLGSAWAQLGRGIKKLGCWNVTKPLNV